MMSVSSKTKDTICKAGIVVALLVLSFIIMLLSPLNPIREDFSLFDSSVFKYVAFIMSRGGMPYRDTFDHKGPLIYIINYAGQMISYYRGLWVIEFGFMFAFLGSMYKIARMFCKRFASLAVVVVTAAPFHMYFEGGNFTEEYALPFIGWSLYFFLDYLLNERITKVRLILCGGFMGCVCMLRVNMIGVWLIFAVAVLVQDIMMKKKKWAYFLLYFVIGFILVVAPMLIWLGANGAFADFINDYIIFNFSYVDDEDRTNILNKYNSFTYFLGDTLVLMTLPALCYLCKLKKDVYVNITYLICIGVTIALLAMSGMCYGHYGMVLIPLLAYPYARLLANKEEKFVLPLNTFIIALLLLLNVYEPWRSIMEKGVERFYLASTEQDSGIDFQVIKLIQEYTEEDEKIQVVGNYNILYVLSQREAVSKYSYQTPIAYVNEDIKKEFCEDMIREMPKIVLEIDRDYDLFPTIDQYELIYQEAGVDVYLLRE